MTTRIQRLFRFPTAILLFMTPSLVMLGCAMNPHSHNADSVARGPLSLAARTHVRIRANSQVYIGVLASPWEDGQNRPVQIISCDACESFPIASDSIIQIDTLVVHSRGPRTALGALLGIVVGGVAGARAGSKSSLSPDAAKGSGDMLYGFVGAVLGGVVGGVGGAFLAPDAEWIRVFAHSEARTRAPGTAEAAR